MVCVCVCVCVCVYVCPVMSDSATPWTAACQAPMSMGFSRQDFWSGLLFPLPGDLPNPETELESLVSPAVTGRFLTTVSLGKP